MHGITYTLNTSNTLNTKTTNTRTNGMDEQTNNKQQPEHLNVPNIQSEYFESRLMFKTK